jgi:hypothetical protein
MRESRHLRLIAALGLLSVSAVSIGCEDPKPNPTSSSTSSSSGGGGGGNGGSGGTAGSGGSGGSGGAAMAQLDAVVTDMLPFDATPDTTGDNVYAVGLDKDGNAVINQAKMDGSTPSKALWTGAPLVSPINIATSMDGQTLYVTDPGAEDPTGNPGRIFSIAAAGGNIGIVTNADGYRPRGLEVATEDGKDVIYFAGLDPMGEAGVFKLPADNSGPIVTVAKGAPFNDPSGIVVSQKGDVYACDSANGEDARGSIIAVQGGAASVIVNGVRAGFPCGVSLTADETNVLVSAFDPVKKTDTVIIVNLVTKNPTYFSSGIDTYVESAGLHRAKQGGNTYAWADSQAGGTGTVFRVKLP